MSPNSQLAPVSSPLIPPTSVLGKEIQRGFAKGVGFELMSGQLCAQMEVAVFN